MEKKDLLLEIGTEELPAFYINPALAQLREWAKAWAPERRIVAWGTPRRLMLSIEKLPRLKDVTVWGPPLNCARDEQGNWKKNAIGFARSQGKTSRDLSVGLKNGKQYLKIAVRRDQRAQLQKEIIDLINCLSFPKTMRWLPGNRFRFARPIRWLLCLWGKQVLPLAIAGIKAGRFTWGHRFFGEGQLSLVNADRGEYERALRENYVYVDPEKRKRKLIRALLAKQKKYRPDIQESDLDEGLLNEVSNLVEYPRVIEGEVEERFLKLPARLLITVMKSHQRYFPVVDRGENLLPRFLMVVNGPYRTQASIRRNNERVLGACLADAELFWEQDQGRSLEKRVSDLEGVIFHAQLGSYLEKVRRLEKLAPFIARELRFSPRVMQRAKRAALLCKSDLTTAMVTEFTELQGTMGKEYAQRSGEDNEVAAALYEHYLPRSTKDDLPLTKTGLVLALADKLDTVIAFLSIGILPTGSQDPYGLKRQAQGVVRLMIEKGLSLSFDLLAEKALNMIGRKDFKSGPERERALNFFKARLKGYLEGEGIAPDVVHSVLASGWYDFADVRKRIEVLRLMDGSEELMAATTVVERTYNIFRSESFSGREIVKKKLLREPEERRLFEVYTSRAAKISRSIDRGDYVQATKEYARTFSRPLHAFFDNVLVNVEVRNLRLNRLVLLHKINCLYTNRVADLTLLQFKRGEYIV